MAITYCEFVVLSMSSFHRSKNGSRTVLRVDVNADGSVPNRSVLPGTGPPSGGSLHRSVTVPFDSYWVCVKL